METKVSVKVRRNILKYSENVIDCKKQLFGVVLMFFLQLLQLFLLF